MPAGWRFASAPILARDGMLAGFSCHIQHSKLLKLVSVTEWVGLSRTWSLDPHIIISDEHHNQKYWPNKYTHAKKKKATLRFV